MNILRINLCLGLLFVVCACGSTPSGKTFAPQHTFTSSDAIAQTPKDTTSYRNDLVVSVMVPSELPVSAQAMLNGRLVGIVAQNGVSSMGNTSPIVLTALVTELSRQITATAPARMAVQYQFLFYVANILSGDIYGSLDLQILGVGASEELALCNAIGSVRKNNPQLVQMLNQSAQKVLVYYNTNIDRILAQAKSLATVNRYDEALALLSNVPVACMGYAKAQELMGVVTEKSFQNHSTEILALMQAAIANSRDYDGYSTEAMAYYAMIPSNSTAKKRADELYGQYFKKLSPSAVQQWERDGKELERSHEFRVLKEELAAKVAIDGQTALLEKYKNDAAYNRLPWLRKLFYFGQ